MPHSDSGAPPAPSDKRLLITVSLVALVLLMIPAGAILTHKARAEADLLKKQIALQAAGLPVSLDNVHARYHGHQRDPAENAASTYERAFAAIRSPKPAMEQFEAAFVNRHSSAPVTAEQMEAIVQVVAENEEAIRLFKEAAAKPYLRLNLDFREGYDLMLPHLPKIREGAKRLAAEALVAAENGEPERAAEAITAIFRIAIHLSEEATLISHLTRVTLETTGKTTLERVFARTEIPADALAVIQEHLLATETGPRLEKALATEMAFGEWIFRYVAANGFGLLDEPPEALSKGLAGAYSAVGLLARDHLFYLSHMEESHRISSLPLRERITTRWPSDYYSSNPLKGQIVTAIMAPSLDRVAEADCHAITSLRATRVALAAERHRLEHGRLPRSLQELVPGFLDELPEDSYNSDGVFIFGEDEEGVSVSSSKLVEVFNGKGRELAPIQFRLPHR